MMTSNTTSSLGVKSRRRQLPGVGLRAGIAKDKLVFIIICSAAMAVALVTILSYLLSGPKLGAPGPWQCVDCDYEFSSRTVKLPPIDCPKCDGQAVRLHYRRCPVCKEEVLWYRQRLTEQGQADYKASGARRQGPAGAGLMGGLPMEFQYRVKQPDGSYGWSPWLYALSPEALQIKAGAQCPHCGAYMTQRSR